MLNSESCDMAGSALEGLMGRRIDGLRRLPYSGPHSPEAEALRQVARDFASLLYGMLIRQMQEAAEVDDEEPGALADGVQDFLSMLLPREVAAAPRDALTEYIYEHLNARDGELVDETA